MKVSLQPHWYLDSTAKLVGIVTFKSNAFTLLAPETVILDDAGLVLAKTASLSSEFSISAQGRQALVIGSHF